ncbi:MAG: hypothetical protein KAR40_06245 [Candidatus Sabulitectum sp.]|nr:hypothetical protein [Candidatus Sabulitectum sp.]
MGYYTTYKLSIVGDKVDVFQVANFIETLQGPGYDMTKVLFGSACVKWYDYEDEMKQASIKFKDTILKLHGNGEEDGDVWVRYFLNGKVQECKAKVTFEEFDEDKLK